MITLTFTVEEVRDGYVCVEGKGSTETNPTPAEKASASLIFGAVKESDLSAIGLEVAAKMEGKNIHKEIEAHKSRVRRGIE